MRFDERRNLSELLPIVDKGCYLDIYEEAGRLVVDLSDTARLTTACKDDWLRLEVQLADDAPPEPWPNLEPFTRIAGSAVVASEPFLALSFSTLGGIALISTGVLADELNRLGAANHWYRDTILDHQRPDPLPWELIDAMIRLEGDGGLSVT